MDEFRFIEDFKENVQNIFSNTNYQEMYVIGMRVVKYKNLDGSDKQFLHKRNSCEIGENAKFIKIYSSVSFHYVKEKQNTQCKEMEVRDKLFGETVFPVISLSEFNSILKTQSREGWDWEYNKEKTTLIIVNNGKLNEHSKEVMSILDLHKEYATNSLNALNMSIKKTNAFIKRFKDEEFEQDGQQYKSGFQPSLEITLRNMIQFIFDRYHTEELSLVSLFKSTANSNSHNTNPESAWINYKSKGHFTNVRKNKFERFISKEISTYYFHYHKMNGQGCIDNTSVKEITVPISFSREKRYFFIIPVTRKRSRTQFRYTIVLMSKKPFKTYIYDNITGLISEYYSHFLQAQKSELLLDLQRKLIEDSFDASNEAKERLIELTESTFKTIVNITNAYSATFRLFDPATSVLKKVVNVSNLEARSHEDEELESLNIDDNKRKSVNCRTFCLDEGENCALYIPNCKDTTNIRKFNDEEFLSIITRPQTLSELCVPFYYQNTVIGVMNFESPMIRAFDEECMHSNELSHENNNNANDDICVQYTIAANRDKYVTLRRSSFIYTVKSTLQHFYCLARERNDIRHLSTLIERENNLHELKNLLNVKKNIDPFKESMKRLLTSATTYSTFGNALIQVSKMLVDTRMDCINSYYELMGDFPDISKEDFIEPNHLQKYLPVFLGGKSENIVVNEQTANSIEIIYKNLLKNYFNHGEISQNTLDVLSVKYQKEKNCLVISQIFRLPLSNANRWFFSPQINRNDTSFGLFIVGTLTRQLGGYIFTKYDHCQRLKRFDIYINLKKWRMRDEEG